MNCGRSTFTKQRCKIANISSDFWKSKLSVFLFLIQSDFIVFSEMSWLILTRFNVRFKVLNLTIYFNLKFARNLYKIKFLEPTRFELWIKQKRISFSSWFLLLSFLHFLLRDQNQFHILCLLNLSNEINQSIDQSFSIDGVVLTLSTNQSSVIRTLYFGQFYDISCGKYPISLALFTFFSPSHQISFIELTISLKQKTQ